MRQASSLIHPSAFWPLCRAPYELVGQTPALEQLYRVLNMHAQQFSVAPVVILLCGMA
jgi:hypothetical protein